MPLWWCLSLGACLGGNGTLVGASANLIVAGIGDRNGVPFRFVTFTLYAFPMMLVSIAIAQRLCLVAILLSRTAAATTFSSPRQRVRPRQFAASVVSLQKSKCSLVFR